MFIAAQFTIAKCWKQPNCPSVNEWIKKIWYIYTMKYNAAAKKKELLPFGNEPGCERQILYDLIYKWNLINKTNKQNITRDNEIKNKLTVTRGELGEG